MNKLKTILLLLLVFISTVVIAFYIENSYRVLVRHFFKFFQGDKIKFFGKDFHLFASTYFVIAFGIFSVLFTLLLYGYKWIKQLIYFLVIIAIFFITTIATTYFDSLSKVAECTACQDGIRSLHINDVNYDFHFISSLVVGLLPLFFLFLKKKVSRMGQTKPPAGQLNFII